MSYIVNQAQLSRVLVDGVDVTQLVLSWTVSDSTLKNVGAMQTSGELVMGQSGGLSQVIDYGRNRYKRGAEVLVYVTKTDGSEVLHPRGRLQILSDSYSPDGSTLTVEVGCKIAMASLTDDAEDLLTMVPIPLDPAQNDFQSASASFASAGQYVYQDRYGDLQTGEFFESDVYGSVTPGAWVSVYGKTALSVAPLQASGAIPDVLRLSYSYPTSALADDNRGKVTLDQAESNYFIQFPAVVFIRNPINDLDIPGGSYSEPSNPGQTTACGNSPSTPGSSIDQPNSCSDGYVTQSVAITQPAKRVQTTETTYNGPGGQISYSLSETRGPAIEVNGQYFADAYSACRFSYATACNPSGNCPLFGMETILQEYAEEFYTYDSAGALVKKTSDSYKNVLAAAQPFNWRAGNTNGQVQGFTELSTVDYYLSRRSIVEYSEEDNFRKERTTTFTSVAEGGSGIGNTKENVEGATGAISAPLQAPSINGNFQRLATATDSQGSGMRVSANFGQAGLVERYTDPQILKPSNTSASYYAVGRALFGGSGSGMIVNYRMTEYQNKWEIENFLVTNPGIGYREGDKLYYADPAVVEPSKFNFKITVTKVSKGKVALSIDQPGENYQEGDRVWVTTNEIANNAINTGQAVNIQGQPNLLFQILATASSAPSQSDAGAIAQLKTVSGPPLIAGGYRNIQTASETGNGVGATINLFGNGGSSATRLRKSQGLELYAPVYVYLPSKTFNASGGSGAGLVLSVRPINRNTGPEDQIPSGQNSAFILDRVVNAGSGYRAGDVVSIDSEEMRQAYNAYWIDEGSRPLQFTISSVSGNSSEAYAANTGQNYRVGDLLTVSPETLTSAGATKSSNNPLVLRVTQISNGAGGNLSINAMNGVKNVRNTSSTTITSLPLIPDVVNTPVSDTKADQTEIVLRQSQSTPGSTPFVQQASVPVPLLFNDADRVKEAVSNYERYIESFTLGDAMGLQIIEGLRDEIIDSWKPGLSFRYYDPRSNQLMAMRMDAVTWGLTPTESAISVNSIFLGESNGGVEGVDNLIGDENVGELPPSGAGQSGASIKPADAVVPIPGGIVVTGETFIDQGSFFSISDVKSGLLIDVSFSIVPGGSGKGVDTVQQVNHRGQLVVYCTGEIVSEGQLLSNQPDGSMLYEYNGSLLTAGATVLLDPFEG